MQQAEDFREEEIATGGWKHIPQDEDLAVLEADQELVSNLDEEEDEKDVDEFEQPVGQSESSPQRYMALSMQIIPLLRKNRKSRMTMPASSAKAKSRRSLTVLPLRRRQPSRRKRLLWRDAGRSLKLLQLAKKDDEWVVSRDRSQGRSRPSLDIGCPRITEQARRLVEQLTPLRWARSGPYALKRVRHTLFKSFLGRRSAIQSQSRPILL